MSGPLDAVSTLAFVRGLALEAGTVLRNGWNQRGSWAGVHSKGTSVDLVTETDLASEALILERIGRAFPDDHILAEESGGTAQSGGRRWLVDPLDGTTNFAHGLPHFCVSIGLEVDGELEVGVVLSPILGWEFAAARGMGATLDGNPIRVSTIGELERSLLATGFPYDRQVSLENNFDNFFEMQRRAGAVRRFGAAALDLCMVAAGWLDGYWEMKLKPWDVAAGVLIVREAAGTVTSMRNAPFDITTGLVVATNGLIHDSVCTVLGEVDDCRTTPSP